MSHTRKDYLDIDWVMAVDKNKQEISTLMYPRTVYTARFIAGSMVVKTGYL